MASRPSTRQAYHVSRGSEVRARRVRQAYAGVRVRGSRGGREGSTGGACQWRVSLGRADALESGGERGSRRSARGECPCDGEPRGRRGGGRRGRLARQRRHESVEALVGERRRARTASWVFGGGIASVGGELRFAGCGRWFDGGGGDDAQARSRARERGRLQLEKYFSQVPEDKTGGTKP